MTSDLAGKSVSIDGQSIKSVVIHRAYSLLEVKEISEEDEHYVVKGMATTPTPDRYLDEIDPMGAEFAESIALLWQHRSDQPVGRAELGKPTKKGIPYVAKIPKVKEAGALRDRIEEAVQSIRYRLVAAVSIGFRVLENALEYMGNGGIRFLKIEILELSLVTIPANAEATIDSIKSIDRQFFLRAADADVMNAVRDIGMAIKIHMGHMDGTVEISDESQQEMMDLMKRAHAALTDSEPMGSMAASGQLKKAVVKLDTPGVSGSPAAKRGAIKLIPRKYENA
jgi:HK97 family phage prohead protease